MTANNWESKLPELFSEDADFTGENGPGYVREVPASLGFSSNLSYALHLAKEEHSNDWKAALDEVYSYFRATESDYYSRIEFDKIDIGDDLVAALIMVD